jgi:hypothetical protein
MIAFKEFTILSEAAYKGNIGVMEVIKFRQKATPEQLNQFHDHIKNKNHKEAWKLIQTVTGVKLHKSAF